ncbi:MAG: hypothetical protein JKY52_10975 [Flavobacteriales bacterium]|nr:hypothetical protein [Flavobacteriales bacterium]
MRNIFLLSLFLIVMIGCDSAINNNEILRLADEKEELQKEVGRKDSIIYVIVQSFNEIEDNLATIKEKQGLISINTSGDIETETSRRERIIGDMQLINEMLDENKKKVRNLSSKINSLVKKQKAASVKLADFQKMIKRLTAMVEAKDTEIASLKNDLLSMNMSLDSMALAYDIQEVVVQEQAEALNTGFFCYGTFKELKEKGVITKKGGFIGIGKTQQLKQDFNTEYFTQVDITEQESIDLFTKKAKVLTNHPSDSYDLKGDEDGIEKLLILDPVKFWSTSKYLVVIVE